MIDVQATRTRILFLITQFDTGGVQFQLYLRLRHLDRARFDCRVLVLTDGRSYLLDKVKDLGVPVDTLHLDDCSLATKVLRIRRAIAAVGPDVVDSMLGWDITYGNAAATLARVPFIVAEIQNERRAVTAETTRAFRVLQALALRCFCDTVVCCSNAARDSYVSVMPWLSPRTSVIHDAIDGAAVPRTSREADRSSLGVPEGALVIGTIGRLTEQKDHATLVRAAARVCAARPHAWFLVAGYGHLRDQLARQIADAGLSARVLLVGEITDPQRFYAMVDVFAMTSRWEGFPVVLLEAMAAGRPVVSTEVGGIAEMIEHGRGGLLCRVEDDEQIAAALLRCLDDPALRASYAARGRERVVGLFSIQRLVTDWHRVYRGAARTPVHASPAVPDAAPESGSGRLEWPAAARRLLLWRLCPLDDYRALVSSLRARYPGALIDAVCQDSVADQIAAVHPGGTVVPCGDGPFTLRHLGVRRLLRLRRSGYDLTIVPYNVAGRRGYRQADAAAALVAPGGAWGITPSRSTEAVTCRLRLRDVIRDLAVSAFGTAASFVLLTRAISVGLSRRPRRATASGELP